MPWRHYVHLAVMTALMFLSMYLLMYAMVDRISNVLPNVNQFYMAGLLTAPMAPIELAVMRGSFQNRPANVGIAIVSLLTFGFFWIALRQQAGVDDEQFLKSMISHHAGAMLMCAKAPVRDTEVRMLCRDILRGQQNEIDQMRTILTRLNGISTGP